MSDSDTLIGEEGAEQLRSIARASVGDSLRSVTYFNRTEYDQLYLRGDLERDADLSSFIGHEWQAFQMTQDTYGGSELGDYEYTLRSFANGYLLRVATDREGVFITADSLTLTAYEEVARALKNELETWRD